MIVAVIPGAPLAATIDAVLAQRGRRSIDVLLVAAADRRGPVQEAPRDDVRWIAVAGMPLVPQLWAAGIAEARGTVFATTVSGCVPEPGWIDAMLDAHARGACAVGGPIVQGSPASLADRALTFARYGAYQPPVSARDDAEVPGDNGSYTRSAIAPSLAGILRDGFWEADVNAALRAAGGVLRMDAGMTMRHIHTFDAGAFCANRWRHGRIFGGARARHMSRATRIARALAAPATLGVLTWRAAAYARRAGQLAAFVPTLPLVVLFYVCWVAGEAIGLIRGSH